MRILLISCVALLFSGFAWSADSRELAEAKRKQLAAISFFCPIGRQPMADSSDAWRIRPFPGCSFAGPLDTKINRLKLEAPILNPFLSLTSLKGYLQRLNLAIDGETGNSLRFRLPAGQSLSVSIIAPKEMQDPLFHFGVIPHAWGNAFLSISAGKPTDIPDFIAIAKTLPGNPVFWTNPHFNDEARATEHLSRGNAHTALPLLSKCGDGREWKNFGGTRSLLIVGDLHNPPETAFFHSVLRARVFAWIGLEVSRDMKPSLEAFLLASSAEAEERALFALTFRLPKNLTEATKENFRLLKELRAKIILLDSDDAYFNFPFTNVSFHGMVMSTRNRVWVSQLPADWQGTAVMLGGLDHFLNTPSSDFQDYVLDRLPGVEMGLIDPNEKCGF